MSILKTAMERNFKDNMESLEQLTLKEIDGKTLTFERLAIRHTVKTNEDGAPVVDEQTGEKIPIEIPMVTFVEMPGKYLSASAIVVKRFLEDCLDACGGDIETLNAAFAEEKPRALFAVDKKARSGRNPTMLMYRAE